MTKVHSNLSASPAEPPTIGNLLEGHLQGGDDRLLAPAQAVDQQDAEHAAGGEARPRRGEIGAQLLGQRAPRLDLEIGQIEDRPGDKGEVPPQEADRHHRAVAPALGRDLAGRRAADDRRRAETAGDFRGEGRDVIVGRDEHDEAGEIVRRELSSDFGGRGVGARAPRRGDHDSRSTSSMRPNDDPSAALRSCAQLSHAF